MTTEGKVTGPASYFPSIEKKYGGFKSEAQHSPQWTEVEG